MFRSFYITTNLVQLQNFENQSKNDYLFQLYLLMCLLKDNVSNIIITGEYGMWCGRDRFVPLLAHHFTLDSINNYSDKLVTDISLAI